MNRIGTILLSVGLILFVIGFSVIPLSEFGIVQHDNKIFKGLFFGGALVLMAWVLLTIYNIILELKHH